MSRLPRLRDLKKAANADNLLLASQGVGRQTLKKVGIDIW